MAGNRMIKRFQREIKEVKDSGEMIDLDPVNESMVDLRGKIFGPPDTPYEGGIFELEIKLPDRYPFDPPKIKFITKIWHPNVSSSSGAICLDILTKQKWAPAMTCKTLLLSLKVLLEKPVPDDAQDAIVGQQMLRDKEMFLNTAKYWTAVYAGGPSKVDVLVRKVKRLTDMGVEEKKALTALSCHGWDIQASIDAMF